jgi:hypothetical protein
MEYYRTGHIHVQYALVIAAGLFVGAFFGARIILSLPPVAIRRIYAVFLLLVAARMLFTAK